MLNKYIIILFTLTSISMSQNIFSFNPLGLMNHSSNGGEWEPETLPITILGAGFASKVQYKYWSLDAMYVQLGLFGNVSQSIFDFSPQQSFPYIDASKDTKGYWTEFATAKISYQKSNFIFEFGKFDQVWGEGIRGIHISNKAPSYPQFGFDWKIKDNLKLIYFHGFLKSDVIDSSRWIHYQNDYSSRSVTVDRFIVAHRIQWIPHPKLIISANESVIYGTRNLDIHYLIPIIPFFQLENYLGDLDNVQMGCDIAYKFKPNSKIYLGFFMDELTPEWLFKNSNHNWFAWQFGLHVNPAFIPRTSFDLEYNWTDHRIFRHKFPINDYYSHGAPLGFWAGPHAEEWLAQVQSVWEGMKVQLIFSFAKRGAVTEQMIKHKYIDVDDIRFDQSLGIEEKTFFRVLIQKPSIISGLNYNINVDWIDWKNAGYDPKNPNLNETKNVEKISINIGVYYNFSIL